MALGVNSTRDGLQRRYFDLRYDGERKLSGVAMRYGDTANLPWGEKERFEAGAFGEVAGLDVILNRQHSKIFPLARSKGGGLVLRDSVSDLRIEANLPDTREAEDTLKLVKGKILRGLSVEFMPDESRMEGDTIIHTKADLRGIGVVDRAAYGKTTVEARSREQAMDEEKIRKSVEAVLAKRDGGEPVDANAIAKLVAEQSRSEVDAAVAKALKERDAAAEEKRAAEEKAAQERADAAKATKAADEAHAAELEQVRADAERVADLRATFASLMPKDFEARGKTAKEILIAACGDEVADSEKRSEDYLLAKAEGILERREAGASAVAAARKSGGSAPLPRPGMASGPVDLIRLRQQMRAKAA